MSDTDLATYEKLLRELKELLPSEGPKALPGVVRPMSAAGWLLELSRRTA